MGYTINNSGNWTLVRVSGSNVDETGQNLVAITGLSIALLANTVYEFEAKLFTNTSADTTGCAYGVNFSQAGASVIAGITGTSSTAVAKDNLITALNTSTGVFMISSAGDGSLLIKGTITVGANAGNLTIQHRKITSGTSRIYIGSYLKVRPIA